MEPTEKDIVIEKIKGMPPEQVSKVLIFIAGLEAGGDVVEKFKSRKERGLPNCHNKEQV